MGAISLEEEGGVAAEEIDEEGFAVGGRRGGELNGAREVEAFDGGESGCDRFHRRRVHGFCSNPRLCFVYFFAMRRWRVFA